MRVTTGGLSVEIDPQTHCLTFDMPGAPTLRTPRPPQFVVGRKPAAIRSVEQGADGIVAQVGGAGGEGAWRLRAAGQALESRIDLAGVGRDRPVELELPLPLSAAVDLPTTQLYGARIDSSARIGRDKGVPLGSMRCQLAAVDAGGACLAFIGMADYTRHMPEHYHRVWQAGAWRDEEAVWLRLQVMNGSPVQITCHPDLEGVIERYCAVLRRHLGLLQLSEDPSVPEWLDELRVFVTVEMHRNDGEILNTFDHVVRMCDDLKRMGIRRGVVIKLIGFQGPFDSRYPYFDPDPELGGPAGMRMAADAIHAGGNRLMTHLNVWGLDPFLENFEELEHLATPYDRCYERMLMGQVGPYDGWAGVYPATPTGFDSGPLPIEPVEVGPAHAVFLTCDVPEDVEALLSLPGLEVTVGSQVKAQVGVRRGKWRRRQGAGGSRVRFPFRFRFAPGRNVVRLDFVGQAPSLAGATYRISGSVNGDWAWSWPIVRADINDPEWIEITRKNLVRICLEYDIDIPYIDAVNIWRAEDRPIFDMIRRSLPGRLFACEYSAELGYSMFRLVGVGDKCVPTQEEAGYPTTDFARRVQERYTRFFPPGYAYVPYGGPSFFFGKLCAAEGETRAYAERHLRESADWGVYPGVRVNYRDYGLDARAAEIIAAACAR